MDFNLSDEQNALKDSLAKFIDRDYTFDHRWKIIKSAAGWSRSHWNQLAEIGLMALPVAEADGGLGGNGVDTMLVMEELGRGLVVEPYLGCVVLPAALIKASGSEAQRAALSEGLASGETLYAFAHSEPGQRYERNAVATTAAANGAGYVLSGKKVSVLGGDAADQLLVSATVTGDAAPSLFVVPATATGVRRLAYPMQDAQRGADIELSNVEVGADALLGERGKAAAAIEYALDVACAALCAEAVGAMAELHKITVEYLKTRKQFGRPIGMNQALQHRAVDMLMHVEMSRSMAMEAAVACDNPDPSARAKAVSAAKTLVSQGCRYVGQNAVQLHGGIGVTHELNTSHYFKRLTMISVTFGDADWHLGRYGDTLLAAA
ncbi:MAG: acyl-CoA dehydrogenase family protein [Burkholderiales bacterium]|nr:acyl-CoA dehydrogenase family protein [Burkholderiales bacterium]